MTIFRREEPNRNRRSRKLSRMFSKLSAGALAFAIPSVLAAQAVTPSWLQWGSDAQHTGFMPVSGQAARVSLQDVVIDPNAEASFVEEGDLLAHYQVPLIEGSSVYMEFKGPSWTHLWTWETQSWGIKRFDWAVSGKLVKKWAFSSDWKPVPFGIWDYSAGTWNFLGPDWEPVFHGAVDGNFVYVPGAGGTIFKLNKSDGSVAKRILPFTRVINPQIFVCGPITVFKGSVYFNTIQLDPANPWTGDVIDSWLVRVDPNGVVSKVSYKTLIPSAPGALAPCTVSFDPSTLPWPPTPSAVAPTLSCGSQRAGLNVAPAVSADGRSIYIVSRAHRADRYGYLIAVFSDLSLDWARSLRGRLNDGCNILVPPTGGTGGCRTGASDGVDPATNESPAGRVHDDSSSSPAVAPDGRILYGAYTRYNFAQGHLFQFGPNGQFLDAYGDFGWDMTAGIYPHNNTYSIVLKENHYFAGSYCNVEAFCPSDRSATYPSNPESYFLSQLSPTLSVEWKWQNTNAYSCVRNPDNTVSCVYDHPNGFEFCVNHVAIDKDGVVYANSEDGNLYVVKQGGILKNNLFLNLSLGAAYTPVSLGPDGKAYTQDFGHMIVVGKGP